ncbi:FAD-dependent oxidoreductase [Pseudoflavonifractor phocaeensis]|uniref:FAD-dependent oxidoreductase n=1 Tax=Pseudoflavonifractor phocaeensis TaxID=1870988 RepID=UPI00210CAB97|nr:FAD-dependent oxidoreductase [Pseudoflavonifractor phocaeensis]MCQ4866663.1 FAD-dependent oxidoreductase [Pseudoflavonifractor phocaeensis]
MEFIRELGQDLPILRKVDVLILGAGPAGAAAAAAAAAEGAETLLLEHAGGASAPDGPECAGIARLPDAAVCVPVMHGRLVRGVVVRRQGALQAVLAGVTIDCTPQGTTAACAGAEFIEAHGESAGPAPPYGPREVRHFRGAYTLTERDIRTKRIFEDWAVKGDYMIPLGCFIPAEIDGLLLAGENISGTHEAYAVYRDPAVCVKMGVSVGIIAAICARERLLPGKIPLDLLQDRLEAAGLARCS